MSVPEIALIYDADCPNVSEARGALREALERLELEPLWVEWERNAPGLLGRHRSYGSPTILIDGADVAGESAPAAGVSCRVYLTAEGFRGVPPVSLIETAIRRRIDASLLDR